MDEERYKEIISRLKSIDARLDEIDDAAADADGKADDALREIKGLRDALVCALR